jgi:3-oxoadipate enol-lactonase
MVFHRIIPLLATNHRVVIPDLRNHGKSDRIRGRFEIADLADDVAGIARALGIRTPVPVFGYSMGGMVAQELALRHPDIPSALILAATAARPFDRARPLAWVALRLSRVLARISRAEAAWGSFLALRRTGIIAPDEEAWMWDALLARDANLYHETAFAIWRFDNRQRLHAVRAPVLVVITERDRVVPVRTQTDLASHLEGATVVKLPDAGHESILSQPGRFARAIDDFLGGLAIARRDDETGGETARRSG